MTPGVGFSLIVYTRETSTLLWLSIDVSVFAFADEYCGVYWVNPSKRGGIDGVFQGLAQLLRGISRGKS